MLALYGLLNSYVPQNRAINLDHWVFLDFLVWFIYFITSLFYWTPTMMTAFSLIYLSLKFPGVYIIFNASRENIPVKYGDNRIKLCILIELLILIGIIMLIFSETIREFILSTREIINCNLNEQFIWALNYQLLLVCFMVARFVVW